MTKCDILNIFEESGYDINRWLIRYVNFVYKFKLKESVKHETEKHHILPSSLFNKYSDLKIYKWNESILTNRAHIIAHYILAKAIGGSMWIPLSFYSKKYNFNSKVLSEIYKESKIYISKIGKLKVNVIDTISSEYKRVSRDEFLNNDNLVGWNMGNKEVSKKISDSLNTMCDNGKTVSQNRALVGKDNPMYGKTGEDNPFYGKKHTNETKKIMSDKAKKRKLSEDTKKKISKSLKGIKRNKDSYIKYNYYILLDDVIIFSDSDQRNVSKFLSDNKCPSLFRLKKGDILNFKFRKVLKSQTS